MAVIRVLPENWPMFDALLRWRTEGSPCSVREAKAPAALGDPNLQVWAAEADGRMVGWISLGTIPKVSWTDRGHLYVDELWVAEGYRRRGYAKMLMAKAEEVAEEMGCVGVRLYVNVNNPGAAQLYRRCGYGAAGTAEFMEKPIGE